MTKFTNFFLWVCSFVLAFGWLLKIIMEYLGIDLADTINRLIFG